MQNEATTHATEVEKQTIAQASDSSYDTFITTYIRTIVDGMKQLDDNQQAYFLEHWLLIEHIDALDKYEQCDQHIANIKQWIAYTKDDMLREQDQASTDQHEEVDEKIKALLDGI